MTTPRTRAGWLGGAIVAAALALALALAPRIFSHMDPAAAPTAIEVNHGCPGAGTLCQQIGTLSQGDDNRSFTLVTLRAVGIDTAAGRVLQALRSPTR